MKAAQLLLVALLFTGQLTQAQKPSTIADKQQQSFQQGSDIYAKSDYDQKTENHNQANTYHNTDMAFAERHNDRNTVEKVSTLSTLKSVSTPVAGEPKDELLAKTFIKNTNPLEAYSTYMADPHSEFSGFGPAYYKDELVFASDRNTERPIYKETNRPFLDLYMANIEDGNLTGETLFPGDINTDVHESNAVFTKDGNTMYFTRNSDKYKRINGRKTAVLQIFRAELINGKWQNIKPLSISSNGYSVAHPSLSPDEKTLYFSSDMPGGQGASDIYKVSLIKKEKCGLPINLGPSVNSENQEQFPFISEEGNLFFASDRSSGYGGLDLYRSQSENSGFSPAHNLGSSINGESDDFSLITKERKGTGYFSSNRTGQDKIYRFDKEVESDAISAFTRMNGKSIHGTVSNTHTGKPIIGVRVNLLKPNGAVLRQTYVNPDGSFDIAYDQDGEYILEYSERMYKKSTMKINWTRTNVEAPKLALTLEPKNPNIPQYNAQTAWTPELEKKETPSAETVTPRLDLKKLNLNNIYFDFDQSNINAKAAKSLDELVILLKAHKKSYLNVSAYADKIGSDNYNQQLSERRANAAINYLTEKGISKKRIFSHAYGESKAISEGMNLENRKCEFKLVDRN